MIRTIRVDEQSISEPVLSAEQLQAMFARILDIQSAIVETHRLAVVALAGADPTVTHSERRAVQTTRKRGKACDTSAGR